MVVASSASALHRDDARGKSSTRRLQRQEETERPPPSPRGADPARSRFSGRARTTLAGEWRAAGLQELAAFSSRDPRARLCRARSATCRGAAPAGSLDLPGGADGCTSDRLFRRRPDRRRPPRRAGRAPRPVPHARGGDRGTGLRAGRRTRDGRRRLEQRRWRRAHRRGGPLPAPRDRRASRAVRRRHVRHRVRSFRAWRRDMGRHSLAGVRCGTGRVGLRVGEFRRRYGAWTLRRRPLRTAARVRRQPPREVGAARRRSPGVAVTRRGSRGALRRTRAPEGPRTARRAPAAS